MPSFKLSYFPIKGIAEVSRLLFVLAGEPFEDDQVPFDQWPVVKTSFAGKTPFEAAWVDALADQWKDYFVEIKPFLGVANGFMKGDLAQLRRDVGEPVRDKHFSLLEKAAQDNGSNGFFVGSSLTWVDLLVSDHITVLEQHESGFFDGFPAVRKIQQTVQADPRLKEYLEKRPVTYF